MFECEIYHASPPLSTEVLDAQDDPVDATAHEEAFGFVGVEHVYAFEFLAHLRAVIVNESDHAHAGFAEFAVNGVFGDEPRFACAKNGHKCLCARNPSVVDIQPLHKPAPGNHGAGSDEPLDANYRKRDQVRTVPCGSGHEIGR